MEVGHFYNMQNGLTVLNNYGKLFMSLLNSNTLNELVSSTTDQIKKKPQDADLRVHLFQYLSFLGQWDRAAAQLDFCMKLSSASMPLVTQYNLAILAEQRREQVFKGNMKPKMPDLGSELMQDMTLMLTALSVDLDGDYTKAAEIREKILERMPANPCCITSMKKEGQDTVEVETKHEWLMDMDSRIVNICEYFKDGEYYWIPFAEIEEITLLSPKGMADLIWSNASIKLKKSGQEIVGIIPARYPLLENHQLVDELLTCKQTNWVAHGENYWGEGQKLFATDQEEIGFLDIRKIAFV